MLMICNVDFVGFVGISFSVDLVMTCEDDNSDDIFSQRSFIPSFLRRVECGCFVYCLLSLLVVRCAFCDVRCVL